MMTYLLTNPAVRGGELYLWLFNGVYAIGALAAGVLGVIAWYNSKRPVGWEDRDRPSFIPEITLESSPSDAPAAKES
ncbi:photosystem II assembly protein Psb35 [Alkalinema pantanalense CENA528]|uniref:photosystem II assembly protein Psb35 n=1 Tax=Alkalinema pantanalense TaxID=1620705 RepID=UPI003D6F95A6